MKKVILLTVALLMGAPVYADTFAGVYGVHTNTNTDNVGGSEHGIVNIAFGQSMDSKIGLGYEAFFNSAGLGGAVEMFTTIGKVKVSIGKMLVPENANLAPADTYPVASSNDTGDGAYIGLSTKLKGNMYLNFKYVRFNTDHTFTSRKRTGTLPNGKPIFTSATSTGSAERGQLWVGITFHL